MKSPEENQLTPGQGLPAPICSRSEFVIVFGPPASGKTLNQAALKAHYKCDHVFDDMFDDSRIAKATGRIMILSTTREVKEPRGLHPGRRRLITDALFVPVSEAAFALGEKWIAPRGFENNIY
jgi:hypothetical protein